MEQFFASLWDMMFLIWTILSTDYIYLFRGWRSSSMPAVWRTSTQWPSGSGSPTGRWQWRARFCAVWEPEMKRMQMWYEGFHEACSWASYSNSEDMWAALKAAEQRAPKELTQHQKQRVHCKFLYLSPVKIICSFIQRSLSVSPGAGHRVREDQCRGGDEENQ